MAATQPQVDPLAVLARKYGPAIVQQWLDVIQAVSGMTMGAMEALTAASGVRASPEAIGIVLQYAHEKGEPKMFVIGLGPAGPFATKDKVDFLRRAVAALDEGDALQVEVHKGDNGPPKKSGIILPS